MLSLVPISYQCQIGLYSKTSISKERGDMTKEREDMTREREDMTK